MWVGGEERYVDIGTLLAKLEARATHQQWIAIIIQ